MTSFTGDISFPQDSPGQRYVSVYALHAGSLFPPHVEAFGDSIRQSGSLKAPSFSFLVEHEVHGRLLFDLGLRKDGKGYPPAWDEIVAQLKVDCSKDVADLLQEGGVQPGSINSIVYSHLHFDHVGDLAPFPQAELIVGADTAVLMQKTYPSDPTGLWPEWPSGQKVRYVNYSDADAPARPIAPLDAPGHLPGHLAALARVSPDSFILLAGDCCHHRQYYTPGVRLVSQEHHHDIDVARDTMERLKRMNKERNVVLVLAHESQRLEEGMPLFPRSLNEWAKEEMARKPGA